MPRSSQFQCPNDTTLGDLPAVLPSAGAYGWLAGHLSSAGRRIADAIEALADYSAAAALYEQLSRLSDAELGRRGLSRDSLARDACAACDRTAPPRWTGFIGRFRF
jgi:hypothetical protein